MAARTGREPPEVALDLLLADDDGHGAGLIDLDRLALPRPELHHDLPAGGRRLLQRAVGYRHTVCAGVETYRDGVATGAVPGRPVRGARPAP